MDLPAPYEAALQAIQEARRQMNIPPPEDRELRRAWAVFQEQLFTCERKACWFGLRLRSWEQLKATNGAENKGH